ncbi:MAG: UDP-N-acetylmuramate dehydrogenase [Tidjanibacter sp.]|nr:UDP-N-acetylmuramate dehydrogenase [Tidjanibacter sp.]
MVRISENINLAEYTSFGAHATATRMVEWSTTNELLAYLASDEGKEHLSDRWTILGEGCNTLFTKDFLGTIIRSTAKGITITEESAEHTTIRVAAGEVWDDVVAWSTERGLWGMENLSAIPSSVGASAVQNIGAYGTEAKDVIESVEVVMLDTLTTENIPSSKCKFGYRESIFKEELAGKAIITAVTYRLSKSATPRLDYGTLRPEVERTGDYTPQGIRNAVRAIRDSKLPDPKKIGNAGSFFKNPILPREQVERLKAQYPTMPVYDVAEESDKLKIATGWMIDSLGWKGKALGRAGVHANQALVLINLGGATGEEVMALANRICGEVKDKFGVDISPEVNVL